MTDFSGVFVRAVPSASVFREGLPTGPRIGMEFLRAFFSKNNALIFFAVDRKNKNVVKII